MSKKVPDADDLDMPDPEEFPSSLMSYMKRVRQGGAARPGNLEYIRPTRMCSLAVTG